MALFEERSNGTSKALGLIPPSSVPTLCVREALLWQLAMESAIGCFSDTVAGSRCKPKILMLMMISQRGLKFLNFSEYEGPYVARCLFQFFVALYRFRVGSRQALPKYAYLTEACVAFCCEVETKYVISDD